MNILIAIAIGALVGTKYAYDYADKRGLLRLKTIALIAYQWTMCVVLGTCAYKIITDPVTPVWGQAIVFLFTLVFAGAFLYGSALAFAKLSDPDNIELPNE